MREIDNRLGKIFYDKGFYFLERVFDDLSDLMYEEDSIKRKVRSNGFIIIDHNWSMEDDPLYEVRKVINDGILSKHEKIRYRLQFKLKYIKNVSS